MQRHVLRASLGVMDSHLLAKLGMENHGYLGATSLTILIPISVHPATRMCRLIFCDHASDKIGMDADGLTRCVTLCEYTGRQVVVWIMKKPIRN